jgi:hypothetical protein
VRDQVSHPYKNVLMNRQILTGFYHIFTCFFRSFRRHKALYDSVSRHSVTQE